MLFSNLQRNGLQLAEKKHYKTPKNTIIELWSSLMNLFVETDTIRVKISNLLRLKNKDLISNQVFYLRLTRFERATLTSAG